MSVDTTEITAQDQWLTYTRRDHSRKQTEASLLIEPDLANGTILSFQVRINDADAWKTIKLFAAADITAGEWKTFNFALNGAWQYRFGCATGDFGAGDDPTIILRGKPW